MAKQYLPEAVAELCTKAKIELVTYVPGFGANEVFAAINERYQQESQRVFPISFHEEVAFTIAHGAALLGSRSCCVIKTHGFEKAANSIIHSLYSGTNAALVTFLFEDTEGSHSDNILEIEPIVKGAKVPYLRSSAKTIAKDFCFAITESERLKLPFIIIINADQVALESSLEGLKDLPPNPNEYKRDIYDHVVCPFTAEFQWKVLQAKLGDKNWKELEKPNKSLNPQALSVVQRGWVEKYETFFKVFQKHRGDLVTGDASTASSFALPPFNCIDIVTYFGGSLPLAIGANLVKKDNETIWAVSGDFAFLAAGHLGLIEALQRNIPLKLIIFSNQQAGATGGQRIPKNVLKTILAGYKDYIKELNDLQNESAIGEALLEAQNSQEIRILLLNYGDS
ncbi:MAG: thiamine pyrophosphate-dependent enzyme [Candidatus Caenarcaniphilales bacterium]|nr:thiamine pyrophosphate-dependent enzyme [Candidatus Caenarcaniphilales bacterium]